METKTCSKCGLQRPINDFTFRSKEKKLRHSICTECNKIHKKQHYQNNKEYYKKKAAKRNAVIISENKNKMYSYLLEHPCVDCGEKDPIVLQFDHVRGKKRKAVSALMFGFSWETVEKEIRKCEVRCANCHQRKTVKQFGWYRGNIKKLL